MSTSLIAVDRSLRELFSALAKYLARTGEVPVDGSILMKYGSAIVRTQGDMRFSVERSFAGFNWQLEVSLDDLNGLINGLTREWPMERLGKSEATDVNLTDDAITKILGSLGFEAPEAAEPEAEEPVEGEEADAQVKQGNKPLTGLEDDLEAEADFGSVSECELDAFLAAYDTATTKPDAKQKKAEEEEEHDPFADLVASIIASGQDDLDDEDEDEEPAVDEFAIKAARSFVDLLLKNEKLDLLDSVDPEELAIGLAPLLDQEMHPSKKADLIMDWLLDQESVDDVYLSDDELISLLRHW